MRWDGDTTGRRVADAAAFSDGATELVDAMRSSDWVAEDPEAHLLPHLEAASDGLPVGLAATRALDDGSFEVELSWIGEPAGEGAVRRVVFALMGSIAETATYVRQRRVEDAMIFELVTGLIGEDTHFAPHGHTLPRSAGVSGVSRVAENDVSLTG
jgi:hypothetical protein